MTVNLDHCEFLSPTLMMETLRDILGIAFGIFCLLKFRFWHTNVMTQFSIRFNRLRVTKKSDVTCLSPVARKTTSCLRIMFPTYCVKLENKCHMHCQHRATIRNWSHDKEVSLIRKRYLMSYLKCRADKIILVLRVCE